MRVCVCVCVCVCMCIWLICATLAEVGLSRSVAFKNQRRITLLVHIDKKEKLEKF